MNNYDVVYIKGNPSSGTHILHEQINNTIFEIIKSYNYNIIESEHKNLSSFVLPNAKIYIGFSRGSRYLKKISSDKLKISIGGVKSSKIHAFTNKEDKVIHGDISEKSMQAHFEIEKEHYNQITSLVANFLS